MMPANLCNTFCEQIIKLFCEKYKIPYFRLKKGFYISVLLLYNIVLESMEFISERIEGKI